MLRRVRNCLILIHCRHTQSFALLTTSTSLSLPAGHWHYFGFQIGIEFQTTFASSSVSCKICLAKQCHLDYMSFGSDDFQIPTTSDGVCGVCVSYDMITSLTSVLHDKVHDMLLTSLL